jgi:multiple sugar transport system ATP-binding protein
LFVAAFVGSPAMNLVNGDLTAGDAPRFTAPGISLDLATYPFREPVRDRAVVLGLRPEDVVPAPNGSIAAEHMFNEPMGPDTLCWFQTAAQRLSMRLTPADALALGGVHTLACRPEKLSVFDRASGARL